MSAEVNMKSLWAGLIGLCAVGVLAGCTPAQNEARTIRNTVHQAGTTIQACAAPIVDDPKYAQLAKHMPLHGFNATTVEQMESTDYPTQSDIQLISDFRDRLEPCHENFVNAYNSIPGNLAAPVQNFYNEEDQGIIALSQGHTTWGQFVQAMHSAVVDEGEQLKEASNQLGAQLQEQNNIEVEQRAQALQNFANYEQQQQAINAMNRPVTTTCNRFGMQTTCTSN
jgi:hypothetical protein